MKAAFLVKEGSSEEAFEIREVDMPSPKQGEVLIKVEAFGLNFADVMARLGHYQDAPPLPAVLGYDVVGRVESVGPGVDSFQAGQKVAAMTRFGGYAEYAIADARAVAQVPEDIDPGVATALTVQGTTAYYCAEEMVRLHEGDHVLIHAAAGGVGTLLVQIAKYRKCVIYGTAGSEAKLQYLKDHGVHYPINYRKSDFVAEIQKLRGEQGLDVIFDPVGGKSLKKGFGLLAAGGRIITFGASQMTNAKNILGRVQVGVGFGIYHPVAFVGSSRSMLGVNMLRLGDERPNTLKRVLEGTVKFYEEGIIQPTVGGIFSIGQLAGAHHFLESRQSMGKVVVKW